MYKLEDFEPDSLLYLHYNFDRENRGGERNYEEVYVCQVIITEHGNVSYNDKIWVNDLWNGHGDLGEKEFIYLDDLNSDINVHIHILIDECYYPDLTKLIDELPEPTKITNFIKSIYPEHFV